MAKDTNFKTKDNFGATPADIRRGHTDGGSEEPDSVFPMPEDDYVGKAPEKPFKGGFCGRARGWER